ncbi:hypothetical protein HY29_11615 [Hyphomonas beringensis]|uniref:Uncharacterized protein n=1 Tax=Hyphomonas beringensis TaxID=1280946 RepID=A0A062U5F0_9PROT|nr:hypothetical protein HY29_11615 [Hyphomonas beringensis]
MPGEVEDDPSIYLSFHHFAEDIIDLFQIKEISFGKWSI